MNWTAFALTFYALFLVRRLLTYLHIYQQEEYDERRYLSWLFRTYSFDRKATLGLIVLGCIPYPALQFPLAGIVFGSLGLMEQDPRTEGKKPLILTSRAKRILLVATSFGIVLSSGLFALASPPFMLWILLIQIIPFLLVMANTALSPYEKVTQSRYFREAQTRLSEIHPIVVGVTGSFGKTSVKTLLNHVLTTHARSFATKGSINTPMGVSRALREEMPFDTKYYIGEMGAYGVGSIKRLCQLTPPHYGIITALGEAHYERFKSLETVARAKFELADAVRDHAGKIVLSSQILEQAYAKSYVENYRSSCILVGTQPGDDFFISTIDQTPAGIAVTLQENDTTHTITAPLFGNHHGQNIALVFAMARTLSLPAEQILIALARAPQTPHRLEVKPQSNGSIYIDDAYNSNPTGFANALSILTLLKPQGGRRILVTPGMAELGSAHNEKHRLLGEKVIFHVDIALIVKPERIPTFLEVIQPKLGSSCLTFSSFKEARTWLDKNVRTGDVILLENDLPDLYEKKLRL